MQLFGAAGKRRTALQKGRWCLEATQPQALISVANHTKIAMSFAFLLLRSAVWLRATGI
jgi:hypothetical protein